MEETLASGRQQAGRESTRCQRLRRRQRLRGPCCRIVERLGRAPGGGMMRVPPAQAAAACHHEGCPTMVREGNINCSQPQCSPEPHLVRHDEGAADVAVLDKALPVGQPQLRGDLDRRRAAAVRHRHHAVDVPPRLPAQQDMRIALTWAQRLHGHSVDMGTALPWA